MAPAFSRPVSATFEGETWSGPEDERGFADVDAAPAGATKVVTGCGTADDVGLDAGFDGAGFESSDEGVSNSGGGTCTK